MIETQLQSLNVRIAELALQYAKLKVPYEHRGTTRNGCDCTGLIIGICRELGYLNGFVLRQYSKQWNLHAGAGNYVIDELSKIAQRVPNKLATVGDIAVMWFGKCPAHCGIIVKPGPVMVHSLMSNGYCKKSLLKNSQWSSRWLATYRLTEEKLH